MVSLLTFMWSFSRSLKKCMRQILIGVWGNTIPAADIIPDLMSHVMPEGFPNQDFTASSTPVTDSSDSESHLFTYSTKPEIESLTATTIENSESVVPSI